jgi:hypothetical protein
MTARNKATRRASEKLQRSLQESPAYRLAYEDAEFLNEDEQRPVRLLLELQKPEVRLREYKIQSTIVVFGSARTLPPDTARKRLNELLKKQKQSVRKSRALERALERDIAGARRQLNQSNYYEEARRFARLVSQDFMETNRKDFVVVTKCGVNDFLALAMTLE